MANNNTSLDAEALVAHAKAMFPEAFAALPPKSEVTFQEQTIDKAGTAMKIFLGYIKIQEEEESPLWAYVKDSAYIQFVHKGSAKVPSNSTVKYTLYRPFSYVSDGVKNLRPFKALVAYYLVVAGYCDYFANSAHRTAISLNAFEAACGAVEDEVMEDYKSDLESLFVPEKETKRKKTCDLTEERNAKKMKIDEATFEKVCVHDQIMQKEAKALEKMVGEKADKYDKLMALARGWVENDKLSQREKQRRHQKLRDMR
ncbi:hypothetical protein CC80DRAFT_511003 [Byssothecium circinans]|uniref:Uncharacterized protein n=1 Tax=Byssothecium circinans TaxID=147558 RepID=A0A6A5TB57_9PLEO|nr:hypothetical protein CC80DRAFT_511003 [Byssothecium circinans]